MGLLFIVVLFWGLSWYAITLQLGDVHPVVSVAWRFFVAGSLLLIWLTLKKQFQAPTKNQFIRLALLGLFLFSANFVTFYFASNYVPSGLISVVFATAVFITVFNQWVWTRTKPDIKLLVGAAFGVTGITALFAPSILFSPAAEQQNFVIGLSLSVLGTWFFSVGNLVSASLSKNAHVPSIVACAMLVGASYCGVAALVLGESLRIPLNTEYLLALLYLSIAASVIAFIAYLTLVAREGAARAGYATVLFPLVALTVSTILEGYTWTPSAAVGVALATLGAVIVFYDAPQATRKRL